MLENYSNLVSVGEDSSLGSFRGSPVSCLYFLSCLKFEITAVPYGRFSLPLLAPDKRVYTMCHELFLRPTRLTPSVWVFSILVTNSPTFQVQPGCPAIQPFFDTNHPNSALYPRGLWAHLRCELNILGVQGTHTSVWLDYKLSLWDFPGGPVVKTSHFQCKEHKFDPWLGNWGPTCHRAWPNIFLNYIKKKKIKHPHAPPLSTWQFVRMAHRTQESTLLTITSLL